MITFPEIRAPSYPIGMEVEDNSLRSNFEDGSMQSRVKFTNGILCRKMNMRFFMSL